MAEVMNSPNLQITACTPEHRSAIRSILEPVGWAEQYLIAFEDMAIHFSQDSSRLAAYLARLDETPAGFVFVEHHIWNQLSQIQGLAVHPAYQRRGIASELVQKAETFATSKNARGIYVDTPVDNARGRAFYEAIGYQLGYIMPRYYEDALDGVTYQKFFIEYKTHYA